MGDLAPADLVRALLQTRTAVLADAFDAEPVDRLLVRSDLTGTMQLYELSGDELVQLTALADPVATANYVLGGRQAVIAVDVSGNECHQLYVLDLREASAATVTDLDRLQALTSNPRFGHEFAGVSPDGDSIAYLSNRANGIDFDLWLCDLLSGGHRLCYASGAYCQPASGFSPDGRLVSLLCPGDRPLDLELLLVDVATGEAIVPLPHPEEAAIVEAPAWVNSSTFYAASNIGRDFLAIVRHDLQTGSTTLLPGTGEGCDCDVVASRDGRTLLLIENRDGATLMRRCESLSETPGTVVPLPEPGVTRYFAFAAPILSMDGSHVFYTLTTPRLAGDVFRYDFISDQTERLTSSPAAAAPEALVSAEHAGAISFDGEQVPFLVFHPPDRHERAPVVVAVHGGPEAQAMLTFRPEFQALLAAGYGVVVPNVRGSTGYGKRYASLDDTTKRLDSVRDLEAVHGALGEAGFDPDRAILWGGSYGGYMVLAGLAFQPDLWAAGVDIVGMSNLVTFLENTSDYRRAFRECEYGSLEHDREFLAHASPLTHVESMRAPLFIIHGRHDPRVPVSEAEQLTTSLRRREVACVLRIYEDEGHGLARLSNRLDAYPAAIAFLDQALSR